MAYIEYPTEPFVFFPFSYIALWPILALHTCLLEVVVKIHLYLLPYYPYFMMVVILLVCVNNFCQWLGSITGQSGEFKPTIPAWAVPLIKLGMGAFCLPLYMGMVWCDGVVAVWNAWGQEAKSYTFEYWS
jgi:hypothetical protein